MERKRSQAAKAMERKSMNPKVPMTKEQKEVTDWLKKNVPTKKTKFLQSHIVDYFTGSKAVDLLLQASPWALSSSKAKLEEKKEGELVFQTREQTVEYLDNLLRFKMFHRAKKIPVTQKDKDEKIPLYKLDRVRRMRRSEEEKIEKEKESEKESEKSERSEEEKVETGEEKGEKGEKKKRKIRLDMHLEQIYVDSTDAYVWLYDPIPWYYWILGGMICAVVILFCLFPLWPRKIRHISGWISFASVCCMIGVIGLACVKYLIFALLYLLSGWKLRFWFLPNLTKDVSFLCSFWPLYDYTYTGEVTAMDEEDDDPSTAPGKVQDDSDSNESGKSTFEIIEKNKLE